MNFIDFYEAPAAVIAQGEQEWVKLSRTSSNQWTNMGISLLTQNSDQGLEMYLNSTKLPVKRIIVRWKCDIDSGVKILGDHWERGYGDFEWRGIAPERIMPWYFFLNDGTTTNSYGVKTSPNSLCFWQISQNDITLCMDVRCGGLGVILNKRKLHAATVVSRKGIEGENAFTAAKEFCKKMCDTPLIPSFPVYGGNNWYYAYGKSSHKEIIEDTKRIADWAEGLENRPFMVIDDGWQQAHSDSFNGGPWRKGNPDFHDMGELAAQMKALRVRPGIWYRPLLVSQTVPEEWKFKQSRFLNNFDQILDPSIPEVLEYMSEDLKCLTQWGYELIKHDFSTYDIFGRWGFDMNWHITDDAWSFADKTKTSAEIIKDMYRVISEKSGKAVIIGCNTISHLSAGMFHIHRTGDDTSGNEWERTRKMGVNTLAFRMPQHNSFYAVDADCVGLTTKVPWGLNEQWLDLLAKSGTPLFISAAPDALGEAQNKAIKRAFSIAAQPADAGEPLDWLNTTCPSEWILNGKFTKYDWYDIERLI